MPTICVSPFGFIISTCREAFSRCQGRFNFLASPTTLKLEEIPGRNLIGEIWSHAHPWTIALPKGMRSDIWLELDYTPSQLLGVMGIPLKSHDWYGRRKNGARWWWGGVSLKQQTPLYSIYLVYSFSVILSRLCLYLSHSFHCPN